MKLSEMTFNQLMDGMQAAKMDGDMATYKALFTELHQRGQRGYYFVSING